MESSFNEPDVIQYLITKAERAIELVKSLHEADDVSGSCNRAYCSMFDAAKAVLLATV